MSPEIECVVIGAGAAGLAAASTLQRAGREVCVLEARERPGGVIESVAQDGYLWERGPNSFRVGADALALLRAEGIEAALAKASPSSQLRSLFRGGTLEPVPMSVGAFATTPLLGLGAKLRVLAEPFVRRWKGEDESVAAFVERRLGSEIRRALVEPFLIGVYAGDARALGAEAVFPALVEFERRNGSIAVGALVSALRRGGPTGLAGSYSGQRGLGEIAGLLAKPLGERLCLSTPVKTLVRSAQGFQIETGDEVLRARSVVLATEAWAAASLLESIDAETAQVVREIQYAPIASVALGVGGAATTEPVEGFGFLVSEGEGIDLLGALFISQVFSKRAPRDSELVMGMIGGQRWPGVVDAPEDEIVARVLEGLTRTLGLRDAPRILGVNRWPRAVPQPGRGHVARVREIRGRLGAVAPGLHLAGGYLDGVSVGDTLASGVRAAGALTAGAAPGHENAPACTQTEA